MNKQLEQEITFQAFLEKHYGQMHSSDSLQKTREKAWKHFLSLGLPSRQSEVYRYIKLKNLFSPDYQMAEAAKIEKDAIHAHVCQESARSVLVFVNGHYNPALSNVSSLPEKLVILPLKDAVKTYGPFLNNQWNKWLKEEADPFAALNAALHQDGIFIYLPPKSIVESPIHILHIVDAKSCPLMLMPRVQLFVGAHSQVSFVTSLAHLSGSHYCVNQMTDIALEEGAHCQYTQLTTGLPDDVWVLDALRVDLKRNSHFKCVNVTKGSATVRNDYRMSLAGENAEASLNGMWMLANKRESHTHVLMDHQAPHCRSTQLFKGVLADFSRSSFEGKIHVRKEAQKTDAFQLNNNLLLSDRANADCKPNLEIFADDVKASHGATMGQLDQDQLFYMKTRGFQESDAKNLLIYSYCKEIIDLIPLDSVRKSLSSQVKDFL